MAKVKTKKRVFNTIMAVAAVVIVVAGVMLALNFKGTTSSVGTASSEASVSTAFVTCEKAGNVNIVRSGLGYALENDTTLKAADQIETLSSSSIALAEQGTTLVRLGSRATAVIQDNQGTPGISMKQGTAAVWAKSQMGLVMCEDSVTVVPSSGALLLLSQEEGSASLTVFSGSVECQGVSAQANEGSAITFLKENDTWSATTAEASENSLQDETITSIETFIKEGSTSVYSADDLQKVVDERQAEREKAQQEAIDSGVVADSSSSQGSSSSSSSGTSGTSGDSGSTDSGSSTHHTCTIEIRCDTILNNMGNLTAGKEAYVPSNGTILATSTVQFSEGDTVFDVLTAACKAANIQLEYTFSSLYGTNYIEGINNLYEFDCGEESGWMYKVNGWFPNYGCSKYELHDGDVIVWCYTCNGLGADVGGGM